jgi:hypothetical protein
MSALLPLRVTVGSADLAAEWDFGEGLEGWAAAADNEMQAEVQDGGGLLRGVITGSHPYVDSPKLEIQATDRSV